MNTEKSLEESDKEFNKTFKSASDLMKYLRGEDSKWRKFTLKYYWPAYRWIRDKIYSPIYYFIHPQHSELRKIIPRSYQELDVLMVEFNFTLVKSLVEKQYGGIDQLYADYLAVPQVGGEFDKELVENWNNFRQQLFNCYKYINNQRVELQKELKSVEDFELPAKEEIWEKYFSESTRIEQQIEELDSKWLLWIISNKNYFWT